MPLKKTNPSEDVSSRRPFLGHALKLGAGSVLLGSTLPGCGTAGLAKKSVSGSPLATWPELPARVFVDHGRDRLVPTRPQGARFTSDQASVDFLATAACMDIRVTCPTGPLARVVVRWDITFPEDTLFLGDAWERSYGDLQWRFLQPERIMPWYFAAHQAASSRTFLAGVKTQPAALCFWTVDAAGVSLWLDFRNGGSPSFPGDREIAAATVVSLSTSGDETPQAAHWHVHDQTLTNAEIILRLYRTLRTAAAEAVLLGCNTMGHLGAGLFEIQRTGDDTSGQNWERTRRMGVNTLAYRLPQNGTFFACDPDCAAHTDRTPWELDRQFLDLVARSGAALFISVDPRTITPEQKAAFRAAVQLALSGGTSGGNEPLDWLHTTSPPTWRFGRERVTYQWEGPDGVWPMRA